MLLLSCAALLLLLAGGAHASRVQYFRQSAYIGVGAYSVVRLVSDAPGPVEPVRIYAESFPAGYVSFEPSSVTLAANSTRSEFLRILGDVVNVDSIEIRLYTDSEDPLYSDFNVTFPVYVVATCGVYPFDGSAGCPEVGEIVYFQGKYRRPADNYVGVLNMTVLDGPGFDLYFNSNTRCPTTSSYSLASDGQAYTRFDLSFQYVGSAASPTDVDFTVGMRRTNASAPCRFTIYAYDWLNATNQAPPNMLCVTPLDRLTTCDFSLLPWQIAVIVICSVVGAVLLGLAIWGLVRLLKKK